MEIKTYLGEILPYEILFNVVSKYLTSKELYDVTEAVSKEKSSITESYDKYLIGKLTVALSTIFSKNAFKVIKDFLTNCEAAITGSFIVNILDDKDMEECESYIPSDIDIFVSDKFMDEVLNLQDKLGVKYEQPYDDPDSYFGDSTTKTKKDMESEDGIIILDTDKPLNKPNIVSVLEFKSKLIFKNSIKKYIDEDEDEEFTEECVNIKDGEIKEDYIGTKYGKFRYDKLQIIVVDTDSSVKEYIWSKFDFNLIKNVLYVKDGMWNLDMFSIKDIVHKYIDIDTSTVTHIKFTRINKYTKRGYKLNTSFDLTCKILQSYVPLPKYFVYILTKKQKSNNYSYYEIIDTLGKKIKYIAYIQSPCGEKCYCKKLFSGDRKHIHIIRKDNISFDYMGGHTSGRLDIEPEVHLFNTDVILFHPNTEST